MTASTELATIYADALRDGILDNDLAEPATAALPQIIAVIAEAERVAITYRSVERLRVLLRELEEELR